MKKSIVLLSFTVLTLIGSTNFAFALARATFPSASKLQPIPVFTHPNVSGNVNSSSSTAIPRVDEDTSSNVGADIQQQPQDDVSSQQDQASSASPFSVNIVTILLIISPSFLIAAAALAMKRRADKNKLV